MQYKRSAQDYVNLTYRFVFHKDINNTVADFLKNISFVITGTLPSIIMLALFNVLAARLLGPAEYGKYTLIQSVAAFLGIWMTMGYDTTLAKFLPEASDDLSRSRITSSAYVLALLFTLATVIASTLLAPQISGIFNISREFLALAILFAVVYTFHALTTNTIRGMLRMKLFSLFQAGYAGIVLAIFSLTFLFSSQLTYQSMLLSVLVAYGVIALTIFLLVRKYLVLKLDLSWIFRLTRYSLYCVVGALSYTVYSNIDKILININLTHADLGIYGAYSLAAISISSILTGCFVTVLFPTASQHKNKDPIFRMFYKFLPYVVAIGVPFLAVSEIGSLLLYGDKYPFYIDMVLLFAVAGVCQSVQNIYGWILNSDSNVGIKISSAMAIVLAAMVTGLNLLLIPVIGIRGSVIAMILSYATTFLITVGLKRRFYRSGDVVADD